MIVVLEGPDFAGKSTLAARLKEHFGGHIHWVGPPPAPTELLRYYLDPVERAAAASDFVVFDRMHVSELVYGPIFRGVSQLSLAEARTIEDRLDALQVVRVHVDAADPILTERFRGPRGDEMVDGEDRLLEVAREYRRLLGGSAGLPHWPKIPFDALASQVERGMKG